jgi:hypothetical protein
MATHTGDARATAKVDCPKCGAKAGIRCYAATPQRPWFTHTERRAAYRAWREAAERGQQ